MAMMTTNRHNQRFTQKDIAALLEADIHELDFHLLRRCINDRGKLYSARKNGVPAKAQRQLRNLVLRLRYLALLPYAPDHQMVTAPLSQTGEAPTTPKQTTKPPVAEAEPPADKPAIEESAPTDAEEEEPTTEPEEVAEAEETPEAEETEAPPTSANGTDEVPTKAE